MALSATFNHSPFPDSLRDELTQLLDARFSISASVREYHGSDISALDPMPPDAVAYAQTLDDIVSISAACYRHDMPMIAYGSGSSLEGWLYAPHGGVSIGVSGMTRFSISASMTWMPYSPA